MYTDYYSMPPVAKSTILNDAMILNSISAKQVKRVASNSPTSSAKQTRSSPTFPEKLMALLDSHEHDDCICWEQGGRSFTVHDAKTLMENVIPLYFKASSYPSFKRKLYRWGFAKLYSDDSNSLTTPFYHKNFIRGKHALCREISCSVSKDLKSSSRCETDFHVQDNTGGDSRFDYPVVPSLGINSLRNASNQQQSSFNPAFITPAPNTHPGNHTNGFPSNSIKGISPLPNNTSHAHSFERTPALPSGVGVVSNQFALRRSLDSMKQVSASIPNFEYEKARDLLKFQLRRQLYSNQRILASLRNSTGSNNAAWKTYQISSLEQERKMLMAQLQFYGA